MIARNRRPAALALCVLGWLGHTAAARAEAVLPTGFQESVVFSGLNHPTAVKFAADGRVFVGEKSGIIKVFDSLTDTSATVFADLRTNVHNFWDRGLLGLELHPDFPNTPYVYVLYALDAAIGGTPPRWGSPGATTDGCPTPPGATSDGCVVAGRLSRLRADGDVMTGQEEVLIEDWFQQYPSHSVGSLVFGDDGALYVSGGEGAAFGFTDYGQKGDPLNPGGDPPVGVGGVQTPPTAEGGALRSQDLETSGDPTGYDGAILRVDPLGAPLPDNPLAGGSVADDDRIIAYGLRNPFRFTPRPGTGELWVGDVGWNAWEEINRVPPVSAGVVPNFGWPCYEGVSPQAGYDAADLSICESLYARPSATTPPFFTYRHTEKVVPNETCSAGSSSVSGLAFYGSGSYPLEYAGALFFADYSRQCIWAMLAGTGGDPDPATRLTFVAGAGGPVQLVAGPQGDLFYVDFDGGTVRRIQYHGPRAVATADATMVQAPATIHFDGSGSSDPDPGDTLSYAWDLDGDGELDDGSEAVVEHVYTIPGTYTVRLRVSDPGGLSDTATLVINVENTPPAPRIDTPDASRTWAVGDTIAFSGGATDREDGILPAAALTWSLILQHCPSDCHSHQLQEFPGVTGGSFAAPDHDYPSHLELKLTATDAQGLAQSASVLLQPRTVDLGFESSPPGLDLVVGPDRDTTPFVRTVIEGSTNSVSAPAPQLQGGFEYALPGWSDGGLQTHDITATGSPVTFTASFQRVTHLALTSSAPDRVYVGDSLGYDLTVTNAGLGSATGVTLTHTLPAGFVLVSASAGCGESSGVVTCSLGTLAQGAQSVVSLTLRPDQAGRYTLSSSIGATELDPEPDDDSASLQVTATFPPTLSISDASVVEGNSGTVPAVFTVSLSEPSPDTVTVHYTTVAGTAKGWADIGTPSKDLTFTPGTTSLTVTVSVKGDTLDENDETFSVVLSAPSGAQILDGTGVGTILDDDPMPSVWADAASVTEGSGSSSVSFTLHLAPASGRSVTVGYLTADGTATAGSDYVAKSGTVTFSAGTTTRTVSVTIIGDLSQEADETFFLNLQDPANATIAGSGQGTILDDDANPPLLSVADLSVTEGSSALFRFSLDRPSTQSVSFKYATAPGTAVATRDYNSKSGTLTIAAGATTATLTVGVKDDLKDEPDETFFLDLTEPMGVALSRSRATALIVDNDPPPQVSIGDASVIEGASGTVSMGFTVSLSAASAFTVSVRCTTFDGTAVAGADYTATSTILSFSPGTTSKKVYVSVKGDLLPESDEAFSVGLSEPVNASLGDAQAIGTILEDDPAP